MDVTKLLEDFPFKSKLLVLYRILEKSPKRMSAFHCPYCEENSTLTNDKADFDFQYKKDQNFLYIIAYIECSNPHCRKTTILCEELLLTKKYDAYGYTVANAILDDENLDNIILSSTLRCFLPIEENPTLIFPHNDDKEFIPPQVLEDFLELQRISNSSPTASAMFARRFLERIILDKWPDVVTAKNWRQGFPTLDNMIDWLGEDMNGQMRYDNIDVMDAIRGIGNKTIHIYSSKENIGITSADIGEIIAELDAIITELYVYPAQRKQRKEHIASLAQVTLEKSKELKKATIEESKSDDDTEIV